MKPKQEELLIVVDEGDNVLDYLPRSEVHAKKLLHRTISVVVFTDKGELVLQKRSLNKDILSRNAFECGWRTCFKRTGV